MRGGGGVEGGIEAKLTNGAVLSRSMLSGNGLLLMVSSDNFENPVKLRVGSNVL